MKETEMYLPVKRWLLAFKDCTSVYAEVDNIDVLGINEKMNYSIAVEMKTSFNMKLLSQAAKRLEVCQYVYIVVPNLYSSKLLWWVRDYCQMKGIGILRYNKNADKENAITEYLKPRYSREPIYTLKRKIKYYQRWKHMSRKQAGYTALNEYITHRVTEFNKAQTGGVQHNLHKLTDYKITIMRIKYYLHSQSIKGTPWCSLQDIIDNVHTHYGNPKAGVYGALTSFESGWVETKKIKRKLYFRINNDDSFDYENIEYILDGVDKHLKQED